jgi:hypothetical protein
MSTFSLEEINYIRGCNPPLIRAGLKLTQLIEVLFPIACGTYPPTKNPASFAPAGFPKWNGRMAR